ncbi:hypothetical protein FACS189425_07010 [Clostridia bacterium]|nr:hypothetical protein FACS189425_07010 [Clostridia bacterium]
MVSQTVSKENKYTMTVKQQNDNDALISLKLTVIGINDTAKATEIEKAFLSYYNDLSALAEKMSS